MPREFYLQHVKPSYEDWLRAPLDQRLAKHAVSDAYALVSRVMHHWRNANPAMLHGTRNEGEYSEYLATTECVDFRLVRDVADAHKHMELNRNTRRLTRSDQTGPGQLGWGEGGFGEGLYGGAEELVVTLDNGDKRALTAVMANAVNTWERLLDAWGM